VAEIRILYCPVWSGYDRRAASLAAELERGGAHTAAAEEGAKSQFDVLADGELVFSKQQEGRFPEPDDVLKRL